MSDIDTAPADLIRRRAYRLWDADGRPEGRDVEYWLRAEATLAQEAATGLEAPPAGAAGLGEPVPANYDVAEVESEALGSASDGSGAERVTRRRSRKKIDA